VSEPVLSARGVRKAYGAVIALDGVELEVGAGECVALVGESGSGKTTLLRCFNRTVDPDAGQVVVEGVDVALADPVGLRRRVGYVQQDGGLLPHWSVGRNVGLVPGLRGLADAGERTRRALDLVGLPASTYADRWPRELSGGQRQRVALARALAAGPSVLLLDEPFGALDALTRADVQRSFAGLARTLGVTTLLVTHDLREAFLLADRVAVMRSGRIEQVATPAGLSGSPGTDYVGRLLARAGVP
jgi:osmoprotectant transport system ATP-binding protein